MEMVRYAVGTVPVEQPPGIGHRVLRAVKVVVVIVTETVIVVPRLRVGPFLHLLLATRLKIRILLPDSRHESAMRMFFLQYIQCPPDAQEVKLLAT